MESDNISEWKPEKRLEHFKSKAEEAYDKMYDCRQYELKDFKDDACMYLSYAIEVAKEMGLSSEVVALEKQALHISGVYRQLGR